MSSKIRKAAKLTTKPTVASVFSGIGGFDLGFERAGFDVTLQCEIESFCCSVLERHWPHVTRFEDIKEICPEDVPDSYVWSG